MKLETVERKKQIWKTKFYNMKGCKSRKRNATVSVEKLEATEQIYRKFLKAVHDKKVLLANELVKEVEIIDKENEEADKGIKMAEQGIKDTKTALKRQKVANKQAKKTAKEARGPR